MRVRQLSVIGTAVAVMATVGAVGAVGAPQLATASTGTATVDRGTAAGWVLSAKRPPQKANASGGEATTQSSDLKQIRVVRYSISRPAQQVATAHRKARGRLVESFIDDAGTITVVCAEKHSAYVFVWREGQQPGRWRPILRHVPFDVHYSASADSRGDIAVVGFAFRKGVGQFQELTTAGGVHGQHALPTTAPNYNPSFKLSADGSLDYLQIVYVGSTTEIHLLQMPISGTAWVTDDLLATTSNQVPNVAWQPGRGRGVAFAAAGNNFPVLGLQTPAGHVYSETLSGGEYFGYFLSVDGPTTARFVALAGRGASTQVEYIAFDADADPQWTLTSQPPSRQTIDCSDNASGEALCVPATAARVRISAAFWNPGEAAPEQATVLSQRRYQADQVVVLDSGEAYVKVNRDGGQSFFIHPAS